VREIENSGLPQESLQGEEPEFDGDDAQVDGHDAQADATQEQLLEGMKKLLPLAGSQTAASTEVILVEGAGARSEPGKVSSSKESEAKPGARAKVPSKGKRQPRKGTRYPLRRCLPMIPSKLTSRFVLVSLFRTSASGRWREL
jgi:hypothetical protein